VRGYVFNGEAIDFFTKNNFSHKGTKTRRKNGKPFFTCVIKPQIALSHLLSAVH
jgi:hypothetical protein